MITIINYGLGNLASIRNILRKIGYDSIISSSPEVIDQADKLILPGVGAFDSGMNNLNNLGLVKILEKKVVEQKTPILGICLGMQLMTQNSEEGLLPGLGWLEASCIKFNFRDKLSRLKIPHMGWNETIPLERDTLFKDFTVNDISFYFVHSYFVQCKNKADILSYTTYGINFTSSFRRNNIFGTQFHPEKSHKYGMQLLTNFVEQC